MAGSPKPGSLKWPKGLDLVLLAFFCVPLAAQTQISLAELAARRDDATPVHADEVVRIEGTVNAGCVRFPGYSLLTIEDGGIGATLQGSELDTPLDEFHPGDQVQAEGKVVFLSGIVAVQMRIIHRTGRKEPPTPAFVTMADLVGRKYLGRLVRVEARVIQQGENTGGSFLEVSASKGSYRLFIPNPANQRAPSLASFNAGDKVLASGVAHQYCPRPPYDRFYELLVIDPSGIVVTERGWFLPPVALAISLGLVLLVSFFLWSRERRLRGQRELLRRTYQLGEEILGASSVQSILKKIRETLPGILEVTRVHLYVHNRSLKTLDEVSEDLGAPSSISLSSPPGGTEAGAVACFHYRTLLVIPDVTRSPFPIAGTPGDDTPRSLLFVPMLSQGNMVGVLELDQDDRIRDFSADEQELAQHLGNQIGVAIRLLDQRSVQEQLFRTEKLAAVGRLISGVVNELQTPLASISELAMRALERVPNGTGEREVSAIAAEAQKASGMVARLVSFAAAEQEAHPVSISALLRTLIEFREGDWKASGIRVRDLTTREPMLVLGSQGQLEQVFLSLFVHAEQSMAEAPQKVITIRTSVLAKRLLVEIGFSAPLESSRPEETAAVLGLTRSVIAGHGGEVRLIEKNNSDPSFEVELPVTSKERMGVSTPSAISQPRDHLRQMTALVIEPDDSVQRQVLGLLAARGFRVVPVNNSDTGLDLAHRMRFDAAFCSLHAPGLNWVELSERMHSRVGGFILLSDGYDAELSADFEGEGRFVLAKPVQEPELDRVLSALEPPVPIAKNGAA